MSELVDNIHPDFKYLSIETMKLHFEVPVELKAPILTFRYNLNIQTNVNVENKYIFQDIRVDIVSDTDNTMYGYLETRSVFELKNFEEVVKIENELWEIKSEVLSTLNIIAIGSTRGVMQNTFKGTFLHGAILPLFDPKTFVFNHLTNQQVSKRKKKV